MDNSKLELKNMRVLIVDDTPANLDVLSRTLKPYRYKLAIAESGEQALKTAPHFNPDLILLDIMMPGIDGYETCVKLKKISSLKDVPIIFVTAKNDADDIVKGFDVGGVDYISKPFREKEVCARVKTHLQLQASLKAQEALNHQKNNFIGMAAHDLRNPLSAILGFTQLILEDVDSLSPSKESDKEMLKFIYSTSNEMLGLVNDLLDISAIEKGTLTLQKHDTQLITLLKNRMHIFEMSASQKNIALNLGCDESIRANLDPNRVGQVIDNLISNAIKFSPAHSTITINTNQLTNAVEVSIQDQGPGIPSSEQENIFNAFHTLGTNSTNREKCTGLGMSIVKRIIEEHGGKIWLDSKEGHGSTFTFSLPLS